MMRWLSSIKLILLGGLVWATAAQADVRVLIRFDASGHHVHREFVTTPANPALAGSRRIQRPARVNQMQLQWFDADGRLLATTIQSDPRLAHAPSADSASLPSWNPVSRGAYVANGPAAAIRLEIELPARSQLFLMAEFWSLMLSGTQ